MKISRGFMKFLEKNQNEKNFFKKIESVFALRSNITTIRRLFYPKVDIEYLFDIRDGKTLQKIKENLKIISKSGTPAERQIIGYLFNGNMRFDDSMIAIICHSCFSFTKRRKPTQYNFKFKNQEEKLIFSIYWTTQVERKPITKNILKIEKLGLKSIFVLLNIFGSEYLIENIVDRFSEDQEIFSLTMDLFNYSHVFLAKKLLKMSRRDKFMLSKIKFDKNRLLMYFFNESTHLFLEQGYDESYYHENISFTGLCLQNDEKIDTLMADFKRAWLRIFLLSNKFSLFMKVFSEIKPDTSTEYKILVKISQIITNPVQINSRTFKKELSAFKETNKCATIEMAALLKHITA